MQKATQVNGLPFFLQRDGAIYVIKAKFGEEFFRLFRLKILLSLRLCLTKANKMV